MDSFQAYAELETDTPGTIYGLTQKTDGKSKSSSFDNMKTQGQFESSEAHEKTDEEKRGHEKSDQTSWKILGGILVAVIVYAIFERQTGYNSNLLIDQYAKNRGVRTEAESRTIFDNDSK